MNINLYELAQWLKAHDADNLEGNMVLDGLEDLYGLETELAKHFKDN